MSTPGTGSVFGSPIIWGDVNYGPTFGKVYRPVTNQREVVEAGDYTVQPYDQYIKFHKTVPAAFAVILPDLALWMKLPIGGFPLLLKDAALNAGTYEITVTPFAGQTIDGLSSYLIAADGASLYLIPNPDLSGWTVW